MSPSHTGPAYEKQMVSLGRILQALRDAQGTDEAIRVALDHVQGEFDFEVAWIGLYDRIHHKLITKAYHSPKGWRFIRTQVNLTPGDVLEQVVIQQRPLIVADLQNEPRGGEWGTIAKSLSLQSAVLFPIRRQDICFGILLLSSPRWGLVPSVGERSHLSVLMGFLAESLHQYEAEFQRQQAKRPDQPLLALLEKLGKLNGLDERLQAIAQETQDFIRPSQTRIFWFEPKGTHFWLRTLPQRKNAATGNAPMPTLTIPVEEIRGFYQSLGKDQLVTIGEIQSSLNTTVTGRMMQLLKAHSLMAAPILYQGTLLGFLSVEGNNPRIWNEAEKRFLQGAARLVALSMPASETENALKQMQVHQRLTSGIVRGIHSDLDWQKTLHLCATDLGSALSTPYFLVLFLDEDWGGYELCFQGNPNQGRGVPLHWPALDDVDWQMMERSQAPISIEDISQDFKLMAWRSHFHTLGIRSLVVCNVSSGNAPEGIMIVADHIHRAWSPLECSLIETVGQQIGLILHQWQMQRQIDQQEHLYESIQWGLKTLQRTFKLEELEAHTLRHIAQLMQVPAALLVSWYPGQDTARITQKGIQDKEFWVNENYEISISSDAIINWALQTDGILPLTLEELPDSSRQWISGPTGCKLLITALRTSPEHRPTAVLVVVDRPERRWSTYHTTMLALLVNQLGWSRRHLSLVEMLLTQREELEQLNWYKQHRFEELHRQLSKFVPRLIELAGENPDSTNQTSQQLLRQVASLVDGLKPLLAQESWQLHGEYETIPLISLLNRLVDRVNDLVQQQQIWLKVHNESNLIIGGDIQKIELILHELVASACLRSQPGSRIDIWCRQVDRNWLELSLTDDGKIDLRLIEELQKGRSEDLLAASPLDDPPGLHFAICHALMQQMGGEFSLTRLEDNRILSRILLPIASSSGRQLQRGTLLSKPFSRKHGR